MAQSKELYDAILNGDAKKAHAATEAALAAGAVPMQLIQRIHGSGHGRSRPSV